MAGTRRTVPDNSLVGLNFSKPTRALLERWPMAAAPIPVHGQFAPLYTEPMRLLKQHADITRATEKLTRGAERALLEQVLAAPYEDGLTDAGVAALARARAKEHGFAPRAKSANLVAEVDILLKVLL